jgi:hypothetical protein
VGHCSHFQVSIIHSTTTAMNDSGKRVAGKLVLDFVIVRLQGGIENRLEVRRGGGSHGGNLGYGM